MKVCFDTFGCRLNRAEALEREAECIARGWTVVDSHAEADLVIVRGCSVTARAQRDCERLIAHIKRKYPFKRLIVEGCLKDTTRRTPDRKPGDASKAAGTVPTRTARAYLKVQDGCSGRCSFCIVPQFRGPPVSIPFDDVLCRANAFIEAGYREIVVTGCNLSLYANSSKRFPDLVDALAALGESGGCRIRIGSLEPGPCARETIEAMAGRESVCRFLHLPVQSGSRQILAAMKRPYTIDEIAKTVELAARLMPLAGIGCDLMSGFPGEREADHLATLGMLRRLPFSNVHVFPYSERPGTVAAGLAGSVPPDVRRARAHILAACAAKKRIAFARRFVGRTVAIVSEKEGACSGTTSEYLTCRAPGSVPRKSLATVRVTRAHGDASLSGALVRDPQAC